MSVSRKMKSLPIPASSRAKRSRKKLRVKMGWKWTEARLHLFFFPSHNMPYVHTCYRSSRNTFLLQQERLFYPPKMKESLFNTFHGRSNERNKVEVIKPLSPISSARRSRVFPHVLSSKLRSSYSSPDPFIHPVAKGRVTSKAT